MSRGHQTLFIFLKVRLTWFLYEPLIVKKTICVQYCSMIFLSFLDEFDVLTSYLSLPSTPSELLHSGSSILQPLVRKWLDHPRVHKMLKPSAKSEVITYPLKLNSLIPLPQDYSDLINSISGFTCPKVISN